MTPPHDPPLLFTPGPTRVLPDILSEMSRPAISHRGSEIRELVREAADLCGRVLGTRQQVLISTSSATGLMEAAVRNGVEKRCLCLSGGAFGERWRRIVEACGKEAVSCEVEWGKALRPRLIEEFLQREEVDSVALVHNETSTGVAHPLEEIAEIVRRHPKVLFFVDVVSSLGGMPVSVEELGIDVCVAGVQKALAIPPGISFCSVSEKVLERSERLSDKGFYFDFIRMREAARQHLPLTTPSTAHLYALRKQLRRVLSEGLEARHRRHRRMAERVRDWARKRFSLFPETGFESDTITCVRISGGMDGVQLAESLRREGFQIAPGYGKLCRETFRIGHLGEHSLDDVERLLASADRILDGGGEIIP